MAERAGFEPAGRWCDHGLASRCLGPLGQRSKKNTGTPGGIRTLKTLCLRQGRMPVPSPGPIQNLLSTSAVPLRDHPVGCGVSLHVAPAGLPRTSPSPPSPAVATTACMGTAEVGREPSRGTRPATLSPCYLQGAGCPIQYGGAPCSSLLKNSWAAPVGAASAVRSPHTARVGLKKKKRPGKPVGLPGRLGAPGLRCLT